MRGSPARRRECVACWRGRTRSRWLPSRRCGRAWRPCRPKEIAMKHRAPSLAVVAAVAISVSAYTFGGWAVVTVDDLPEYLTVGQPTKIAFAVRQHGMSLMSDVHPEITATDGKTTVRG